MTDKPTPAEIIQSGDIVEISRLTGYPAEFCELAVAEWRDVSAKIGKEPLIDERPGGFQIRNMGEMRHLQAVLKKLSTP